MTNRTRILNDYFLWLVSIICEAPEKTTYKKLYKKLHSMEFYWSIDRDINRAVDGIKLREYYADACRLTEDEYEILEGYLQKKSSVLEVFIALAKRCEEDIMHDHAEGDRTAKWFWIMFTNLGLEYFNDSYFDEKKVEEIIFDFMDRRYSRNGKGGPFYLQSSKKDFRRTELWYQMCLYLDENFSFKLND